jgi:hypothetical protein
LQNSIITNEEEYEVASLGKKNIIVPRIRGDMLCELCQ